jgi:glycosyltransferase involved in cell wall biosynthesis
MKFSIITPTLQRDSLLKTCESIDRQTSKAWEHIVVVDGEDVDREFMAKVAHPQRRLMFTSATRNYGNHQRWFGWMFASGEWLWHLDDDNWASDSHILADLAEVLEEVEYWAIFPIKRHGVRFFHDPPGLCMTDTANVVVRREIGRWPDGPEYTMDGIWVEALKAKYPYKAFPDFPPIIVMPKSSEGR